MKNIQSTRFMFHLKAIYRKTLSAVNKRESTWKELEGSTCLIINSTCTALGTLANGFTFADLKQFQYFTSKYVKWVHMYLKYVHMYLK